MLAELKEICRLRQVDDEKCLILTGKRNRRALAHYFTCWRGSLVRVVKKDLMDSIESKATGYFRQRKKSVIGFWSHVALGLNSKKNILERRRGGLEKARESLLKRLEEKGDVGMIITPDMIDYLHKAQNVTIHQIPDNGLEEAKDLSLATYHCPSLLVKRHFCGLIVTSMTLDLWVPMGSTL